MKSELAPAVIAGFDFVQGADAPDINDTYRHNLSRLVLLQDKGVTHFYGCYLDLEPDNKVWMSPVEVDDGENYSYFQVLYVNTTPQEALDRKDLPVSGLEVNETSFKLNSSTDPEFRQLMAQFDSGEKHILVRYCNNGMAYYPRSITPRQETEVRNRHLEKLIVATGLREPELTISLVMPSQNGNSIITPQLFDTVHAKKFPFNGGEVYSYGILLEDDPWQYYEVFTPRRIEKMTGSDLLVRIDSGCDIGQIYDDHGCDCREQFHGALAEMQQLGRGVVIHIPAQDGRGYGTATKMETEGLKRGIEVATNHSNAKPVDTITAAQMVLGTEFDIRTYRGAGRLLTMLGLRSIILQTDNRLKTAGVISEGIDVRRTPTNTSGANGSMQHVEAKHLHSKIYYEASRA
ncbi:MAG: hypothetical protein V4702_03195 [Patescibacteria group bacterium]